MSLEDGESVTTMSTGRVEGSRARERVVRALGMEMDADIPFILQGPGVNEKEVGVAF